MTVAKIMSKSVVTIEPNRLIADVAALLSERRIGAALVTSVEGKVAGIISERDVVRAIAREGAAALDKPVASCMTRNVVTCNPGTLITQVMAMMTEGKFRHVPVIEGDRLVGIVSIGDVVKRRLADFEAESAAMRDYIASA
ncbi:CBS domain-containing protein [Terrarubrum flagellatum]|uniref:CBS domain-containing protein n=1 Tax=Terrirubrum flagellatum TaxID=2895980 RepID=UPI0031453B38